MLKKILLINLLGATVHGLYLAIDSVFSIRCIWKLYIGTVWWRIKQKKIIAVIDTTFAVLKGSLKKFRLVNIQTLNLFDNSAALELVIWVSSL